MIGTSIENPSWHERLARDRKEKKFRNPRHSF